MPDPADPKKKYTIFNLAKDVQDTNARLNELSGGLEALAGEIANFRKEIPAAMPVDENAVVEKVQAQLARSLLPAIEQLQSNLHTVAAAVEQVQQGSKIDENRIQTQVEAIFQRNLSGIQASIAQQVGELRNTAAASGRPAVEQPPSRYGGTVSLFTNLVAGLLAAAQANPEGVKAIASLIRPSPPVEAVLMDKMAQSFKLADTITKMQRAIASGEDVSKVIQSYATPAKT
jgi:hypothetical protein